MKVRHLVEPSPTCDTRVNHAAGHGSVARESLSTPIDADLRDAAAGMLQSEASTMLVIDGGSPVGVITVHDLLRGALADDDQQLCRDLGEYLVRLTRTPPAHAVPARCS